MAGEHAQVISEWTQWLVGFAVAVVVGVATKMGWAKGSNVQPENQVEVIASAVDNRAIKSLIETIDHAVDRMGDMHDDSIRRERRTQEMMEDITDELRKLVKCMQQLADSREI